jgi:hypothetical protein
VFEQNVRDCPTSEVYWYCVQERRFEGRQALESYVSGTNWTKRSVFHPKYPSFLQSLATFCARLAEDIFLFSLLTSTEILRRHRVVKIKISFTTTLFVLFCC